MLGLLAIALAAAQPAAPPPATSATIRLGRTASIFATVGHSEWCPAGNVTVDLRTGRFALTRTAPRPVCQDARLERPVERGRLGAARLAGLRSAYLRIWSEDMLDPACRDGGHPDAITISNGGTAVLVATSGWRSLAAPEDLGCWSDAAKDLRDALDEVFSPEHRN